MTDATDANAISAAAFKWSREQAASEYQAPEAFLCIVSLAAVADHGMAALESDRLQQLTRHWWESGVIHEKEIQDLHRAVSARLSAGGEAALQAACKALPAPCRLPVFAQALDIMLVNGELTPAEAAFSDALENALQLEASEARRMRECMQLKNAY